MKSSIIKCCTRIIIACILIAVIQRAQGQSLSNVVSGYKNTWAVATSYGSTFDGKAWLWGVSTDYTKGLKNNWVINASIAFDQETDTNNSNMEGVENSFSLQLAAGKMVTKRLVIGCGFAKGIINNNDQESEWKFLGVGDDWGTGIVGSYAFWIRDKHSLDISGALEYRINESKFAYSFDLGYGFSF